MKFIIIAGIITSLIGVIISIYRHDTGAIVWALCSFLWAISCLTLESEQ